MGKSKALNMCPRGKILMVKVWAPEASGSYQRSDLGVHSLPARTYLISPPRSVPPPPVPRLSVLPGTAISSELPRSRHG